MASLPVNKSSSGRCDGGATDSLANLENLTPSRTNGQCVLEVEVVTESPQETPQQKSPPQKSPSKSKNSKTYVAMAHDAIVKLKDRTGSSSVAIGKYIKAENPHLEQSSQFRSNLNKALKSAVKSGRFVKIKASYKINSEYVKKEKAKQRQKACLKKKRDLKLKETSKERQEKARIQKLQEEKRKRQEALDAAMTEEEREVLRAAIRKQEEAEQKKLEAERLKKEIAERIKKRKFPMDDLKLLREDKELGVKPPSDVIRRPALPHVLSCIGSKLVSASRSDNLYGSRGLMVNLFQVYHFFRGDVGYCQELDFGLKHLMHAVGEVLNGNARKSRVVPPLISHLFVTCLRHLTTEGELQKLQAGLHPASWGEVCFLYMDAMERYYTTDASVDPNVLQGGYTDMQYLMRASDVFKEQDDYQQLPMGYCAYLGDPRGCLAKAHAKLETKDPWSLTAEELMALLRALTDDVLASREDLCEDIAKRDEQMYELLRAKKSADSQFRKIRLAFEGPRRPSKAKSSTEKQTDGDKTETEGKRSPDEKSPEGDSKKTEGEESAARETEGDDAAAKKADGDDAAPKFKPTASKRQFETAKKNQQKANDAYEKGLRKLVSRREPVGYDRNHNAVYFFNHDPEMLYVEMFKPPAVANPSLPAELQMNRSNWHIIDNKSLFDQFVQSLDIRGTRENQLYDALLGPVGGSQSLRRFLFDDIKERTEKVSRKKDLEELHRRLANAKIACAAEEEEGGRRSGRLASRAQIELSEVEHEIEVLEKRIKADEVPKPLDYYELTGLEALRKFDNIGRRETRRTREQKQEAESRNVPAMPCSILWCTGNIDGTGVVGSVVSKMLELEEYCEALSPLEGGGRSAWISNLEDVVHAWNSASPMLLGPNVEEKMAPGTPGTPGVGSKRASPSATPERPSDEKRRKLDSYSPAPSTPSIVNQSVPQILASLKPLLLELEQRVLEITGLAMATRDADEADDNMSIASNEEEETCSNEGQEHLAWKKKVYALASIPTSRYGQIRDVLVEAIAAARKAHLSGVVAELRSALLLHHPNAAGECKAAAIGVLERHGGYEDDDDDSSEESDAEDDEDATEEVRSVLSGEAMMINGSLAGDENANRVDWIDAVKGCKTMSRFAAVAFAFLQNAIEHLKKIEGEGDALYDALKTWEKEEERQKRARGGKTSTKKSSAASFDAATEVWANVRFTDNFCMAKVENFPAWPAKKCEAKDPKLVESLKTVNRALVSLIGEEGGLRVVKIEDITPYTGKPAEADLSEFDKDLQTQLDECLAMTRRIVRGRKKSQRAARETVAGVEEKKSV